MGNSEGTVGQNAGSVDREQKELSRHFPCSFPLKVMGLNTEDFSSAVLSIVRSHLGSAAFSCSRRSSSGDKYTSLTVTFMARNKEQVDAIYRALNAHHLVLMIL